MLQSTVAGRSIPIGMRTVRMDMVQEGDTVDTRLLDGWRAHVTVKHHISWRCGRSDTTYFSTLAFPFLFAPFQSVPPPSNHCRQYAITQDTRTFPRNSTRTVLTTTVIPLRRPCLEFLHIVHLTPDSLAVSHFLLPTTSIACWTSWLIFLLCS